MEMADAPALPLEPPMIGFLDVAVAVAGAAVEAEESGRLDEKAPKLKGSLLALGAGAAALEVLFVVIPEEVPFMAPKSAANELLGTVLVSVEEIVAVGAKASKVVAGAAGAGAVLLKAPKSAANISFAGAGGPGAVAGEGAEKSNKSATGAAGAGARGAATAVVGWRTCLRDARALAAEVAEWLWVVATAAGCDSSSTESFGSASP